jgi:hypothetical protein
MSKRKAEGKRQEAKGKTISGGEANQNWGAVEQKAYERITEGSDRKNVPAEEILSWLSDLEQQQ